jgi:transposase
MFLRKTKVRSGGTIYEYVRIVENYRENGKTHQRVVANLGSIKSLKRNVAHIIKGLCRICNREDLNVENLKTRESPHYGDILAARHIWKELELDWLIAGHIKHTKVEIPVELVSFLMVANRLIDPLSKLAISRWYKKKVYLRELEKAHFFPHDFYRSMDFLEKMKEDVERFLYNKLCDLFTLKLNLVFYDTTSSYFEGEGPSMAKYGKSRDHRPDKRQIVIGLLVTDEGIPIAHEVFEGDEADKATVVKAIDDLKRRFKLKRVIFVADRGMVSQANLDYIKEQRYSYIVTLKKRHLNEAKEAIKATADDLEEKRKSYEEKASETEGKSEKKEPLFSEYRSGDGPRYLVCLNPEKKKDDEIYRLTRIEKGERNLEKIKRSVETGRLKNREKILKKAALALDKTNRKYFSYSSPKNSSFSYFLIRETLQEEERLDGIFIIKSTAYDLLSEELIRQYKNLAEVERAFKEIKDFLRIRPIRHYQDDRVRAHVFICVLSYLLEKILEKKMRKNHLDMTAREALDKLDDIRIAKNQIGPRVLLCPVQGDAEHRKILNAVGIKSIPRVLLS